MLLDETTRGALRRRHWRVPEANPRQRWMIVLAAVVLHLLFVLAVRQMMQPPPAVPTTRAEPEHVLQVRFISRQPPAVAARPPAPIKPLSRHGRQRRSNRCRGRLPVRGLGPSNRPRKTP